MIHFFNFCSYYAHINIRRLRFMHRLPIAELMVLHSGCVVTTGRIICIIYLPPLNEPVQLLSSTVSLFARSSARHITVGHLLRRIDDDDDDDVQVFFTSSQEQDMARAAHSIEDHLPGAWRRGPVCMCCNYHLSSVFPGIVWVHRSRQLGMRAEFAGICSENR